MGWFVLLSALALVAFAGPSRAASEQQVVPGYWSTTGCPGANIPCFIPYGASVPTTGAANLTLVPLDASTVVTGGTAVTALTAGHRTRGGFLITSNAAGICVSENGTAGTATGVSGGVETVCVAANVPYYLAPMTTAVSVNSGSSSVNFSGYGLQ